MNNPLSGSTQRSALAATGQVDHICMGTGARLAPGECYTYDGWGNLTEQEQTSPSVKEEFEYDLLHRLTYSRVTANGQVKPPVQLNQT
jgi:hypothetical protein